MGEAEDWGVGDLDLDVEEEPEEVELDLTDKSCLDCAHRNTCVIFQKFGQMVHPEQWEGPDDPPIGVDELAVICDDFQPEE